MKRGRSVTRSVKLNTLKLQGIDFNVDDQFFFCRQCEIAINSDKLQKA